MATQPSTIRAEDVPFIPVPEHATGYELVNGELVTIVGSNPRHAYVAFQIAVSINDHLRQHPGGMLLPDTWCHLALPHDRERLRAADVGYYGPEKSPLLRGNEMPRVLPDLVVEIYSPTNDRNRGEFFVRLRDYMDAGTPLLWLIFPDARYAMVHRADNSGTLIRETDSLQGEDILPGFSVVLGDLFAGMP